MNIDTKKLIPELKAKHIDDAMIKAIQDEAKNTGQTFYDVLEKRHLISSDELGKIVARVINYPYVDLTKIDIPSEVLEIVPENIALKQGVITFAVDDVNSEIKIATTNPFDLEMIHDLEKKTGHRAKVFYTTFSNIKNIIGRYHQELKNIFLQMLPEHMRYQGQTSDSQQQMNAQAVEEEVNIVQLFDTILVHAYRQHASDIHIEANEEKTVIRYRIDGVLHKVVDFPKAVHEPLVARCKILAGLRIDETRTAQDGRISTDLDNDGIAFRVSILPTHFGEKVVMRLLIELKDSVGLIGSGLSESDYKKLINNATKPYGMMVVTGPTGSGKTTTLYSIIKLLNSEEVNIATIEDPIEYGIDGINQVQVNHSTNLTFANGLRSLLRQDPDSILVGEVRDQETAQIAVESAMTGHMVFTTLHANSAAIGIPRLVEMGLEPFLLTAAINSLIAQRLLRKLCPHCMQSFSYTPDMLQMVYSGRNMVDLVNRVIHREYSEEELSQLNVQDEYVFYKGLGCSLCGHTGYKGRTGIYEVMEMTENLKRIILKGGSADEIEQAAVEEGMTTMLENGVQKALSGMTSLEEVIRVIKA